MNGSVCENCVAATANELGVWRVHHVRFESEADIRTAMEFPALPGADTHQRRPGSKDAVCYKPSSGIFSNLPQALQ